MTGNAYTDLSPTPQAIDPEAIEETLWLANDDVERTSFFVGVGMSSREVIGVLFRERSAVQ